MCLVPSFIVLHELSYWLLKPTEQPKPKTKGNLRKRKLRKVFKGASYSFQTFPIFAFISFMGSAAME